MNEKADSQDAAVGDNDGNDGWDSDDGGWDVDDDAFEEIDGVASPEAGAAAAAAAPSGPPPPPPPPAIGLRTPETVRPKLSGSTAADSSRTNDQQLQSQEQVTPTPGGGGGGGGGNNHDYSLTPGSSGGFAAAAAAASFGNNSSSSGPIFFADATLDLEEAHDLAETPVPSDHGRRGKVMYAEGVASSGAGTADGSGGGGGGDGALAIGGIQMPTIPPLGHEAEAGLAGAEIGGGGGNSNIDIGAVAKDGNGMLSAQPSAPAASAAATANTTGGADAITARSLSAIGTSNSNGRFESDTPAALPRPIGPSGPRLDRPMASASSGPTSIPSLQATYRPKRPNRPRDLRWATAALTFIPTSLSLPFMLSRVLQGDSDDDDNNGDGAVQSSNWEVAAQSTQGHTATFLSTTLAFGTTFVIGRLLYRTAGGGDGDDDRHRAAGLIVMAAPISLAVLPILALVVWLATPSAWPYGLLPLFFFFKDIVALRAGMAAPDVPVPSDRRRGGGIGIGGGGGGSSEGGRRTFFMALSGTALDILSRSLRRQSFYRFVTAAMGVQFVVVLLWKSALFKALAVSHTAVGKVLVLLALLGGKWATGLVSRMLSLVASGGVTSWFAQQSILIDEMERMKDARREEEERKAEAYAASRGGDVSSTAANDSVDDASEDYVDGLYGISQQAKKAGDVAANASARAAARAALHAMPEAYRSVDASIYSPVIDFDEGIDDDFEDEDEEEGMFVGGGGGRDGGGAREMGVRTSSWTGGGSGGRSTVKSFVVSGATVSFGSVAQCGLLGGPAQFVWSVVRNADALGVALTRRFSSSAARFGFRGMSVSAWDEGDDGAGGLNIGRDGDWRHGAMALYGRFDLAARDFVRAHSDLAMSHVAAYFKSYQRAANDVAALIDASGVEPIIHDDITTRMCAAVGTAISSIVVIFIGYIVAHHRGTRDPLAPPLSDQSVCEIMLLSFIFSYTVIFTIMEPLRASIKAVYVCFAQHPQSLSQAFPLIFHRLTRISEANIVV